MARSIHTTHRQLEDHAADDFVDVDDKREEARRLRASLARKRRIKAQVSAERRTEPATGPAVNPATIPIVVDDDGDDVHHGATLEELVAVMRRLPRGVVDGIRAIRLGLGPEYQLVSDEPGDGDVEPFRGPGPSHEVLPGIRSGRTKGVYRGARAEIYVCAYEWEARQDAVDVRIKALYLTLRTLATFVHEVAHHHDSCARVARGRWLADDRDKAEEYAEQMEHQWMHEIVIPYLEETRAADVEHLREWLVEHGGADVPLGVLLDDPRLTNRGGVAHFFRVQTAFSSLLEAVATRADPVQTRLDFARELHYTEEYAIPRAILAGVLAGHPRHPEASTLLADIDVHEGLTAAAEARCRDVLAADPSWLEAWEVLVETLSVQQRWAEVVETTTCGIACAGDRSASMVWLLRRRARARLELGDDALDADLAGLALGRGSRRWAWVFRAMQLLRRGALEDALAIAVRQLAERSSLGRVELAAVRFDAAHRLGRSDAAGTLTPADLERLRGQGHDAWVDHLARLVVPPSA